MRPRLDAPSPQEAARAGVRWLIAQAALGFPGVEHVMRFPRAGRLLPGRVEHRGASFAQAVLGGLLLDVAEALHEDRASATALRSAAARLAEEVAAARSPRLAGGWRYFPALASLPPDLDSLAAAVSLFERVAPQHLLLAEEPVALALSLQAPSGAMPTWLIAPQDPWRERAWMRLGVRFGWGDASDVDVCARFASALRQWGRTDTAAAMSRLSAWVAAQQEPTGRWPASWYAGDAIAAGLALSAVAPLDIDGAMAARSFAQLRGAQDPDGGWGPFGESAPLDTAVAIALLRQAADSGAARAQGIAFLCDRQTQGGGWKATPWIRMDIGRARGRVERIATWGCAAISTAACVRTLLQVTPAEAAEAAEATWTPPPEPRGPSACGCRESNRNGKDCRGCKGCKEKRQARG